MKRLVVVLILLTLSPVAQPQTPSTNRQSVTADELRSLVRKWDEAYVKGDAATLDRLLADEFAFVGGPAKAEYLASVKSRNLLIDSAVSRTCRCRSMTMRPW